MATQQQGEGTTKRIKMADKWTSACGWTNISQSTRMGEQYQPTGETPKITK